MCVINLTPLMLAFFMNLHLISRNFNMINSALILFNPHLFSFLPKSPILINIY